MRFALLILTLAALTGCSKSEAPARESERGAVHVPTTAPVPAPADAGADRPVIAVLGDSLAEGFGVGAGQSYPDVLQRKLDRAGYRYRVVNLGVSGDTTTGGLRRLGSALSLDPDVLVIELGGNDGLRGVPVSATHSNLEQMVSAAKKADVEVLLAGMTLPPNYGRDYIRRFEAIYHDIARKHKVQLVPSLMQPIASEIESRPELMQRDGIHPAPEGHELLADVMFRYLKPMLRK
jgi:acyl-CoA thioesterase-1